jgi:hypothetical protein
MLRRFAALIAVATLLACAPPPKPPPRERVDLAAAFASALAAEAKDPLASRGYLDALDAAVAQSHEPWSASLAAAALDALVWRRVHELPASTDHAVAHRSRSNFVEVTERLRVAHERGESHPIIGPMIAYTLQELAMRVGAEPEAIRYRKASGCIETTTIAGPLAWPARSSLDAAIAIPDRGAMPKELPGIPPFATRAEIQQGYGDACAIDFEATGSNGGLRAVVVDLVNPRPQWIYLTVGARSPIRVDLAGKTVVRRAIDAGTNATFAFGRARVEAGRARLMLRIALDDDRDRVILQALGEDGKPLAALAPREGERAEASAGEATTIDVIPEPTRTEERITAAAAALALGQDQRAAQLLDDGTAVSEAPAHVVLLRMRAWRAAQQMPATELDNHLKSAADAAVARCPQCWEARIALANAALLRQGSESGSVAALEKLEVVPNKALAGRAEPELAYIALLASRAGLLDVSRRAYDALANSARGSALAADVDAQMIRRVGGDQVDAACRGGTSRSTTRCTFALLERGDLSGALAELRRLRSLRGSPALFRKLELAQLLAYGQVDRAERLFQAMPPAQRDSAVLALLDPTRAREHLERDMLRMGDAPFGYEPLARLVGVAVDPAPQLEREGATLVARDRVDAFLPDAGTAVLRHVERYELGEHGLLHYWTYDLRRVSDTEDVAEGAQADDAQVMGKWSKRTLRRRIHKRDGRVLDPDPSARGQQGHTDLSQLEQGDYVEQIDIGWALPEEHGQIVVDGPDLLPPRTSVREATIELVRPKSVAMKLWAHTLLGAGATAERDGKIITKWQLANQAPRRLEQDVPELEARVAISFGTDDYTRIGRAIGEVLKQRDDSDPFIANWVKSTLGDAKLDDLAKINRITAAVGKAVRQSAPASLGDHLAVHVGGQDDTARQILERGDGSRTFVIHRALREAGISSRVAIAETEPFSAAPTFPPHVGRFRHPLLLATAGDARVWIDADVDGPPLPPGRVSPELRGRTALLPTGETIVVDATSGEDADQIDIALEVDDKGDASGSFKATIHGRPAQRIAGALETLVGEQRTDLLRSIVLGWLPWADARDIALSSDEGSWQISVTANISAVGFAQPEDRQGKSWSVPGLYPFHRVLPRPAVTTLASQYTAQADRESAMAIDPPLFYRVHRKIKLPTKAKVLRLAKPLELEAKEIRARRSVSQSADGALDEQFELNLPVGVIVPADFEGFATRVRQIDDGFLFTTRIELGRK